MAWVICFLIEWLAVLLHMQNREADYSDWGFLGLSQSLVENACHNSFLPYPSKYIISKMYNACSKKESGGFRCLVKLRSGCNALCFSRLDALFFRCRGWWTSPVESRSVELLTRLRGLNTQQPQEFSWLHARRNVTAVTHWTVGDEEETFQSLNWLARGMKTLLWFPAGAVIFSLRPYSEHLWPTYIPLREKRRRIDLTIYLAECEPG
jgi:hypothetical protein